MLYTRAVAEDLPEILELQYLAFQSEARILKNTKIPPLVQDLDGLREEFDKGVFFKAVDDEGKIIGSSRGYREGDDVIIRKLIVDPAHRCNGYGTKLLYLVEKELPSSRYVLYTSNKSVGNVALFETLGYSVFKKEPFNDELTYIYMEKIVNN